MEKPVLGRAVKVGYDLKEQADHYEEIRSAILFSPPTKKSLLQQAVEFRKRALLED